MVTLMNEHRSLSIFSNLSITIEFVYNVLRIYRLYFECTEINVR